MSPDDMVDTARNAVALVSAMRGGDPETVAVIIDELLGDQERVMVALSALTVLSASLVETWASDRGEDADELWARSAANVVSRWESL